MLRHLINPLRGTIVTIALVLSLAIFALKILLIGGLIRLIPCKRGRWHGNHYLQQIPLQWARVNRAIIRCCTRGQWHVPSHIPLNAQGHYLLIANHRSWVDILILTTFFADKLPIMKFFMKKELLWSLPIAGLACYLLGYPFMERHSPDEIRKNPSLKGKDILTAQQACIHFKEFPTTVMNFVEGTRFSAEKKEQQGSPYQGLLKPKAMGVALVVNELQKELDGIINVTLAYGASTPSFWHFVCGQFQSIYLNYEVLPVTADLIGDCYNDRQFRKQFQNWLNDLWHKKDLELMPLTTVAPHDQ